ncbi:MAG: uracil-DNA glycosylase [Pseudomonadota bacterium]
METWTHAELAMALEWQVELGVDEAISEAPIDRYALEAAAPAHAAAKPAPKVVPMARAVDPVGDAKQLASGADTLAALRAAMGQFEHCELKRGARNLVFSDGHPSARVMILGEAPGRDEDQQGKPFVGRAGQLLDKMLGAIGLDRGSDSDTGVYITNVLPWRPPQNRDPKSDEIAMLMPFVERHIALAGPDVLITMGNISCQAMLGKRGITRLRGQWTQAMDLPVLPMFHPAYLLRNPAAKREAWADLLELQDWLDTH